jgi:hypothetical protein
MLSYLPTLFQLQSTLHIVNCDGKVTRISKETDVTHLKVLFQHLPGETRNPDRDTNSGPELGRRS